MIEYRTGNQLDLDQVIELYRSSTLGERRPIDDRERMRAMLENANLVITAWDAAAMVGIARSLTDWVYITYLSDLAVALPYQRRGIGAELIRKTQDACGPKTSLLLLSAPKAVDYYPRIGMVRHESAWWLPHGQKLPRRD